MSQLPISVHLIPKAPHLDIEGLFRAIPTTEIRELRALGNVGVFEKVESLLKAASAEIHGLHELVSAEFVKPIHHFVQAELVGFCGVPGQIETTGSGFLWPNAVFPPVTGHKVASRIPYGGDTELFDEFQDIGSESVSICTRMGRLIHSAVNTPAKMFYEGSE
jgi:hypothetical protein